jgi:antitoxin (DNA-binding transcriptional repressor) of toxin-antitoxin stability system
MQGIEPDSAGGPTMTVTIEEAKSQLQELIANLPPNGELHISQNGRTIAKLTRAVESMEPRKPGSAAHLPHWMADDFDAPLEEFREYME